MSQLPLAGLELRDAGTSSVSENTPGEWRAACDAAIVKLALSRHPFTADDVRRIVGDPPNHPNAMGARFLDAVRAGVIRQVGRSLPERPSRHASSVGLWVGIAPEQLALELPPEPNWIERVWGKLCDPDGTPWPMGDPDEPAGDDGILAGPVCCPRCGRG